MSLFFSLEATNLLSFSMNAYFCNPSTSFMVPNNTKKTGSIMASHAPYILLIRVTGYISQICDAIIGTDSINMISVAIGKFSEHIQPR